MKTKLFKVTTRFLGADNVSAFYYDDKTKADNALTRFDNGEITEVSFESDAQLNYSDGCTYNELTFGGLIKIKA